MAIFIAIYNPLDDWAMRPFGHAQGHSLILRAVTPHLPVGAGVAGEAKQSMFGGEIASARKDAPRNDV